MNERPYDLLVDKNLFRKKYEGTNDSRVILSQFEFASSAVLSKNAKISLE